MTSPELLPCPWCGPMQSMVDPWFDDVASRWTVGCGRCGASVGRSVHAEGSKESALEAALTRAPSTVGESGTIPSVSPASSLSTQAGEQVWRPIESAPKDGTAVMLGFWYQGRFAQYQAFWGELGWMEHSRTYHPKHFQNWFELWHPLPSPPSKDSSSSERVCDQRSTEKAALLDLADDLAQECRAMAFPNGHAERCAIDDLLDRCAAFLTDASLIAKGEGK